MSHSVTVTRTVTSSNTTSALVLNTGYVKTLPGLLKLAQLILGAICVGILVANYNNNFWARHEVPDLFFLLMATTFFIGTFCLLVSCLFSLSTGGIISKTIYELIYHSVAAILILIASIWMAVRVNRINTYRDGEAYKPYVAATVLGIINGILYIWSAVLARKSYRGI